MSRPRGFAPYRPQGAALNLIAAVDDVLEEYSEHLPLTLRQVFYRLVAMGRLGKSETDYKRLGEIVNRARRAALIPFGALRDDGVTQVGGKSFADLGDVLETLRVFVADVRLDRQDGQLERLQIWCEAAGMVPQLLRIADPYGVPVISSGGFDSVTVKHEMGRALAECPATVLHIGDHDPSGVHIFSSLSEDVSAFAAAYSSGIASDSKMLASMAALFPEMAAMADGYVEFVRLAVTPDQAEAHSLPSAPPKPTDRRSFDGYQTWQCEALPPDVLAEIVRSAIVERIDPETLDDVLAREREMRQTLAERLNLASAA